MTMVFGAAELEQEPDNQSEVTAVAVMVNPQPETEIPEVVHEEPRIAEVVGALPMMVNTPMSILFMFGPIRVIVKSPAVTSSIVAEEPYGPAAVLDVPPGAIAIFALPQSTVSIDTESIELTEAEE